LGDFYYLSLKTWVWRRLFILEMPPSRHHYTFTDTSICSINNKHILV
jgi:hypothetical protein